MSGVVARTQGQLRELPLSQVYRYMGLRQENADEALVSLVNELLPPFLEQLRCSACWLEVPVRIEGQCVDFGMFSVTSGHLARNLQGCDCAVLFAATLGMQTELQKKRAAVTSPAKALVLDAMGNAAIEAYCEKLCAELMKAYPKKKPRPRFSPGYGDFPLAAQKDLLRILDANRKIGVTLTDGMLMIPQKTVTAVLGFGEDGCQKNGADCDDCNQLNCMFRR